MADEVRIRGYERRDRVAVRRLCCDTVLRGEPVDRLFSDREVVADLLTRYYTDEEPQACWVAEEAGRVIGYLTGCLDRRRHQWRYPVGIVPRACFRAMAGGALCRRETWRWLRAVLRTWRLGGSGLLRIPDSYPAHLHINLAREARGRGIGERLVKRFLRQADAACVRGVYAAVRGDNPPARRFFERLGFVPVARSRVVFPVEELMEEHETVVYGKRL